MSDSRIYLDHAATTPVAPGVLEAMMPFFTDCFGNPSSVHGRGRETRRAVEKARRQVAEALGAEPREIYFTSGGTESDNWAIRGIVKASGRKSGKIITTQVEHHAVLHTCRELEQEGWRVVYLPADGYGRVRPEDAEKEIDGDTVLISVMTANNEIGTLEPAAEIGEIARSRGIPFHTDAVQAVGAIPVSVKDLNADLLSLSAHKFHGPKGIGALYVRGGLRLGRLMAGGAQERGMRAGTENVPGIAGLGKAIEMAAENQAAYAERVSALRDRLIHGVLAAVPDARLNGHPTLRLPNNAHFSFPGVESEALLLRLDLCGIEGSGGSACTSGTPEVSHVLRAAGLSAEEADGSLRLTPGSGTTEAEIDETLRVLPGIVQDLRNMRSLR